MTDFTEQLNKLRLLAGVQIKAEHGKRKEQPVEQLDEARRPNPNTETVIQGIKEIIQVLGREQQNATDDDLEQLYAGDKKDWQRILQLVHKDNQQAAQRAVQRLDTAARDYIDAPKNQKTRKAVAQYLGVELLGEADNSNRQDTTDQGDQNGMQEWKPWSVTVRTQDGQTETVLVNARNKSEAKRKARQQSSDGSHVTGEPERTDEDVVNEEGAGGQSSYQITYNDGNEQKTKTVSAGNKAAARRMGPQGKRVTKVEQLDTTNEAHKPMSSRGSLEREYEKHYGEKPPKEWKIDKIRNRIMRAEREQDPDSKQKHKEGEKKRHQASQRMKQKTNEDEDKQQTSTGRKAGKSEGESEGYSGSKKRKMTKQLQGRVRADEAEQQSMAQQIKALLDQGHKVRSAAAGRMGQVTKVDGRQVFIKSAKPGIKGGVTTFDSGDPVEIKKQGNEYVIVNNKQKTNEAHYYGDGYPSHEDDDDAAMNVVDYDQEGDIDASTNSPDSTKTEVPQQTYNRGEESSETQEAEVKVPNDIKQELKDTIEAFRNEAERLEQRGGSTAAYNREFYNNTAEAFEDLLGYLELGTIEGIKGAQIYASKLMGPMLHKIPTNTWKFIQRGGINQSLKSYMGQVHDDYPITGPRNTLDDNNWSN